MYLSFFFVLIAQLTTLRSLCLVNVSVTSEGFQEITKLIDLHFFTVMDCLQLTCSKHFSPLSLVTNLRVLHLINVSLDDEVVSVVWPLTCLAQLCIRTPSTISQTVQRSIRLRLRRGVATFSVENS
jgi:hypothetical protein